MADSNIVPDPAPLPEETENNKPEDTKIDALLRRTQRVFGGVSFHILVAPRDQKSGDEKLKIIDLQKTKAHLNIDPNGDKNIQIAAIRHNYKQLLKKAREVFAKVKEDYKNENVEVLLLKRNENSKNEHQMQSDSDLSEAELELETDADSESDSEWELKSEPEPRDDKELSHEDRHCLARKKICKWNNYPKDLGK